MRRPIRGNIRVGVPITLEPGPDRISPPKRVSTVYHGPGFAKHPSGRCRTLRKIFALAGIHRRFIARCYRRGCPAVALQCRVLHYGRRVPPHGQHTLTGDLRARPPPRIGFFRPLDAIFVS